MPPPFPCSARDRADRLLPRAAESRSDRFPTLARPRGTPRTRHAARAQRQLEPLTFACGAQLVGARRGDAAAIAIEERHGDAGLDSGLPADGPAPVVAALAVVDARRRAERDRERCRFGSRRRSPPARAQSARAARSCGLSSSRRRSDWRHVRARATRRRWSPPDDGRRPRSRRRRRREPFARARTAVARRVQSSCTRRRLDFGFEQVRAIGGADVEELRGHADGFGDERGEPILHLDALFGQ